MFILIEATGPVHIVPALLPSGPVEVKEITRTVSLCDLRKRLTQLERIERRRAIVERLQSHQDRPIVVVEAEEPTEALEADDLDVIAVYGTPPDMHTACEPDEDEEDTVVVIEPITPASEGQS